MKGTATHTMASFAKLGSWTPHTLQKSPLEGC